MKNKQDFSNAPESLALREFDDLYEEDEELFAWVDNLLEDKTPAVRSTPCAPSPRRQNLPCLDVKNTAGAARPSITERQMRALSRKHLLLMLRDLEQELLQVTRERDNMLMACRAGLAHTPQAYRAGCSHAE